MFNGIIFNKGIIKKISKRKDHIIFSSIDTLKNKYNKKSKIITGLVKNNITIYKR